MLNGKSAEKVDIKLQCSRDAFEKRGTNVSRSKTEYLCKNENFDDNKVHLQGMQLTTVKILDIAFGINCSNRWRT